MNALLPLIFQLLANPQLMDLIGKFLQPAAAASTGPDKLLSFDVKWLQESLNKLLNESNQVTGKYDDATKSAVLRFQKKHPDLVADGWAGTKTCAVIFVELQKQG